MGARGSHQPPSPSSPPCSLLPAGVASKLSWQRLGGEGRETCRHPLGYPVSHLRLDLSRAEGQSFAPGGPSYMSLSPRLWGYPPPDPTPFIPLVRGGRQSLLYVLWRLGCPLQFRETLPPLCRETFISLPGHLALPAPSLRGGGQQEVVGTL